VLFRLGDFYETFDEDARITSRELEIVLTSREMVRAIRCQWQASLIMLLIITGQIDKSCYKVAICEQLTKPGEVKGIVQRDVIRVVTPGTVVEPVLLDSKANNYLVSLVVDDGLAGISYVDITTSEFATTQLPLERVRNELERLKPSEVIVAQDANLTGLQLTMPITRLENYWFETEVTRQVLLEHFGSATLEGFGCSGLPLAISAAGSIVHYIGETQKGALGQLTRLSTYSTETFMVSIPDPE